jgi:hypothetical protein
MSFRARVPCALLVAGVAAIAAGSARAASFVVNVTADPALGTIVTDVDVSSNAGQVWTSAAIAIGPITLNQGDDLTVNVTFSGGLALQLQSGVYNSGLEEIDFTLLPLAPGTTVAASSTLSVLSGAAGDLDATLPITDNFTAIDRLGGTISEDLTDTSFQYAGWTMQTTYTSLTGGPVTISSIELVSAATTVAVVPEPSTAALLVAGLVALARVRRG